jgi:hypothetical protein
MGVIVDSIQEVINIPEEKISVVPYINSKVKSEYIRGIAETGDTIKIILDILKVLTEEEFVMIKEAGKSRVHQPRVREKTEPTAKGGSPDATAIPESKEAKNEKND